MNSGVAAIVLRHFGWPGCPRATRGGEINFTKSLDYRFFARFLQDSAHFDGFVQVEQVDLLTAASAVISRMIAGQLVEPD